MENYQVVLVMSVFVLLGALYVTKVEQKMIQIKDELLQHGNEIKKGKEGLESTNTALKEVKVELVATRKELTQVKVELELTNKELIQVQVEFGITKKELKQAQVELESTKNAVKEAQVELKSTRNELQQVKVELESTKKEIKLVKVELESMKKEVIQVQIELESTKKEDKLVKVELDKIKTELHTQRPGFYVTLSSHTTLHQNQRIEFDQVITDVTNNYNKITGIYTVPKDGLYHFSFTMLSSIGRLHAEIVHNHQVIGRNVGTAIYVSATINAVISCKQGESVFVRHFAGKGTETINGDRYPAFSGFLIN